MLYFSMVAAQYDEAEPMDNRGMILSFNVCNSKKKTAQQALLGRYSHAGQNIRTVDLFNAVQRLGGAEAV